MQPAFVAALCPGARGSDAAAYALPVGVKRAPAPGRRVEHLRRLHARQVPDVRVHGGSAFGVPSRFLVSPARHPVRRPVTP
ncbi:hypothetical protein GCM10010140_67460 [Streptosporangium pseudovulgare]|uniref:Uncharacterized protein n=1 Tax=Streptosporangium pseudovulgare TaxID=35765 RepID=A0ABQ2RIA8_9ACTN|nr:hypothetical protein GCM10010140_67460 [Streptosporangium pseudovulgare]